MTAAKEELQRWGETSGDPSKERSIECLESDGLPDACPALVPVLDQRGVAQRAMDGTLVRLERRQEPCVGELVRFPFRKRQGVWALTFWVDQAERRSTESGKGELDEQSR